ncbi:MAG: hypothetical protein KME35_00275 [Aphanocapsa sp. GSE-SYN-MK-11-07L]|nr:hypothetical protein [Aphanocapsa sp. GSE-SYN-MK-11-07L]
MLTRNPGVIDLPASTAIARWELPQYPFQVRQWKETHPRNSEMSSSEFQRWKEIVQPDSRGRLSLGAATKGKSYRVSINAAGQILLDPVVTIPERELWLWQNPEAIAAVQRGIEQATAGELHDQGSFAEYAELEVEE